MTTSKDVRKDGGTLSAKINGKQTSFTQIEVMDGVLGLNNENEYIFVGFPDDLPEGDHDIGEQGVTAYVAGDQSGAAVSGKLRDFKRDGNGALTAVSGKFEFTAVDEYDRDINVTQGAFDVSSPTAAARNPSDTASAKFEPELDGIAGFVADNFSYSGTVEKPTFMYVRQTKNLPGIVSTAGVMLNISHQDAGKPAVSSAFVVIGNAILSAHLIEPHSVTLTPGKEIEVQFEVEFKYRNEPYKCKGSIVMNL